MVAWAQEPEFIVEIDRNTVFEGDTLVYQVKIFNMDNIQAPDLSYLNKDFEVASKGQQVHSTVNESRDVATGKMRRIVRKGVVFGYELTPKRSGKLKIPPPSVRYKGKPFYPSGLFISHNPIPLGSGNTAEQATIELNVISQSDQDLVFLEMHSDRESFYPLQPIELKFDVFIKAFPGENKALDPLIVANRFNIAPPNLNLPWLDDATIPNGIDPMNKLDTWITPYYSRTGGFIVNRLRNQSIFPFSKSDYLLFKPKPEPVKRKANNGSLIPYWKYTFSRGYIGERIGVYNVDPVTFKGVIASVNPNDPNSDELVPINIFVKSNPFRVEIKDVPEADKPDSYLGAFGHFTWRSSISSQTGRVGDPLKLTLRIEGTGSLKNIKAPELEKFEGISEMFKVHYPPGEEFGEKDRIVFGEFTFSIRPLKEGEIFFPSIPMTYFDVVKEKFQTVESNRIKLKIEATNPVTSSLISAHTTKLRTAPGDLELFEDGIFANMTDPAGAVDRSVNPFFGFLWVGTLLTAYSVIHFVFSYLKKLQSDPRILRRKGAYARARDLWSEGNKSLMAGGIGEGFAKLQSSIAGLISDMSGVSEASLAPKDICRILREYEVPENTIIQLSRLLDIFDAARYGYLANVNSPQEASKATLALLETLYRHLRNRSSSPVPIHLIFFFLIPFLFTGCSGAGAEAKSMFEEAQSVFDSASNDESPDNQNRALAYKRSAMIYQKMIDKGIRSGPIFYNQGNAWFRAGEKGRALVSYRQAEEFMPGDPYVKANIKAVIGETETYERISWVEYVFFWQNWISYSFKVTLFMFFGTGAFVCACLATIYSKPLLMRGAIVLFAFTLLFGGSSGYDWYRFDHLKHVVTINENVIPRKGNSTRYEPVFKDPLPVACEGIVIEERGDWVRFRLENNQTAWLPKSDLIVY